ncbi:outer membrane lipoprotein-sorting protein [Alkalimarinus coralli]|uniref:outer membrane lipoprotein-sorting protein n=1 Tax=Alkalimarinus coralli TaxID=2935863 RepID=UPI00202AC80A|nr:outer membrane lipoprotein-sorting protein [Alkalimarinus coralli]
MNTSKMNAATAFFGWVVDHPKRILFVGVVVMVLLGSFLPTLQKDTRSDAFLAADNPALLYKDQVKEIFGLSDPLVIAVAADQSIFTPEGLNTISLISSAVSGIDNVDPEGITSLATENNISGNEEGLLVESFYEGTLSSQKQANQVRDAIREFPLYQGTLVAKDETASLVVVEILDDTRIEETYQQILKVLKSVSVPSSLEVHVAGEGAVAGYMGRYIDSDARRLNPLAALIITVIVFVAFRRFASAFLANVIIAGSAVTTFGAMAAFGVPFFVITNALPVILIGIAVADSIHIYSEYFERRVKYPEEGIRESIVESLANMWRPVTLTTLTTAAGFMGLYFAADMPPFKFFGLFTAFGVGMAWAYSLVFLPAAMSLLKTQVNPKLAKKLAVEKVGTRRDIFASFMKVMGLVTTRYPKLVVSLFVLTITLGLFSATQLIVNDNRIETFHKDEPIYLADQLINERFNGSSNIDLVVETPDAEGIFSLQVLEKMEALQRYAEQLPGVQGSVSVVDYLKQMNRSLNDGKEDYYRLPDNRDLVAQYFLLYSASGSPNDFEEEIDFDYRIANIRIMLNDGNYVNNKQVIESLQHYLDTDFNTSELKGNLSGRVNLNYHWLKGLGTSHFAGMGIALFLVWLVSAMLFGSTLAGLYALIPVATSILFVYSAMVIFGIDLGIGTSMFSAVAIGLGVDFAIHTIDRIKVLYRQFGSVPDALNRFYPSTGRALLFNLLAIAFGFGVLISSRVVPLNNFGTIVALSMTTSFVMSMTLLPALILLFKPRFIIAENSSKALKSNKGARVRKVSYRLMGGAIIIVGAVWLMGTEVSASELPEGRWVAEQINAVEEGEQRSASILMKLTDRRGKTRERETRVFRKYYGEEKRTVMFYLSPRNVKNTAFLTYDYPDELVDDDQWLYLPALRKARRISASDRGDYFLGTDLTYEDMKKEGKLELADYHFKTISKVNENGKSLLLLESHPLNDSIAKELGYGKVHAWVDTSNWLIVRAKYWDVNLNELKTLRFEDIRQVDGIWTRHRLIINHHKTAHQTEWLMSEVDYLTSIDDQIFRRNALSRGAPN